MKKIISFLKVAMATLLLVSSFFVPNLVVADSSLITQINFTSSGQSVNVNTESGVMTVQTQNVGNTSEQVSASQDLILSSSSVTGEFSNSNSTTCTGDWSLGPRTLAMSSSTANKNFCYRDSAAGIYNITVSADGQVWTNATQSITVVIPVFIDSILNGVYDIGEATFSTIQAAITAASSTDTIIVGAGPHTTTGQVLIDKNLSIIGVGGKPIISPDANLSTSTGVVGAWFFVDEGIDFNLENVVLDGNGMIVTQAIRNHGNTVIEDVDFTDIKGGHKYIGTAVASYGGIVLGGAGSDSHNGAGLSASTLLVNGSTFSGIQRIGVLVKGTEATATTTGNVYTGKGVGDFLDYGFEAGAGSHINVSGNNTISNNRGEALDGSTSAGILVTTYWGPGTSATIDGNTITNNTAGISVGFDGSDGSFVVAHNNTISGNDFGIESTAPLVDATKNWWGHFTGPFDNKALPGVPDYNNPSGTGNSVTSYVEYKPWYTNSEMNSISSDKEIISFDFPEGVGVITETNIAVAVPFGTVVTSLVPSIVASAGASTSPETNVPNDFTEPQTYTVTAIDGSTKEYVVTVTISPQPTPPTPPSNGGGGGGGGGGNGAINAVAVAGDTNGDGRVDITDFNILMTNWGRTGSGIPGDLNGDGTVDTLDFNLLMANWR